MYIVIISTTYIYISNYIHFGILIYIVNDFRYFNNFNLVKSKSKKWILLRKYYC